MPRFQARFLLRAGQCVGKQDLVIVKWPITVASVGGLVAFNAIARPNELRTDEVDSRLRSMSAKCDMGLEQHAAYVSPNADIIHAMCHVGVDGPVLCLPLNGGLPVEVDLNGGYAGSN